MERRIHFDPSIRFRDAKNVFDNGTITISCDHLAHGKAFTIGKNDLLSKPRFGIFNGRKILACADLETSFSFFNFNYKKPLDAMVL
jgi:hypothetical protein